MKRFIILLSLLGFFSCQTKQAVITGTTNNIKAYKNHNFTIAFGSGNNQKKDNPFWADILNHKPNVWIWGGDNIYCDTDNMAVLAKCYHTQKNKTDYQNFKKNIPIIGVWDDHDYGVNDGGAEYPQKDASQQLFLDFLDVDKNDLRRKQKGTYTSNSYSIDGKKIKIILLDTRYFRTALTKDTKTKKRYKPNTNKKGTMLGEAQWKWLEETLANSTADYNIIKSSIQFLSDQHGYEAWGNMPHEAKKLENIILKSKAKNVIILSGDRHISEISSKKIGQKNYNLIDFTSSGLTHAYTKFTKEFNPYRVSKVVHQKSYGLVKFDFKKELVIFEMWGEDMHLLETYKYRIN